MLRFTLFGIPVSIQPWFWLVLALLSGRIEANSAEALLYLLVFVFAGFISVLVHEFGHALTAKAFGAAPHIVLHAFGGYAAFSGVQLSRKKSFMVTLAGPAIQILLGIAAILLLNFFPPANDVGKQLMFDLFSVSMIWALLNLLPILPLDGGQMLDATLGRGRIRITLIVSIVTAIAAGLLAIYFMRTLRSFFLPILMASLAYQAYSMLRQTR